MQSENENADPSVAQAPTTAREWKDDDEVGKLGPGEMFDEGGMIYLRDLSPEVQAILIKAGKP
ncbi:MAG: hypothetical protein KGL39_19725 [Patescibacteria group bacterium]|nr:hypothetical protein [Patescibacteria group bacterium]